MTDMLLLDTRDKSSAYDSCHLDCVHSGDRGGLRGTARPVTSMDAQHGQHMHACSDTIQNGRIFDPYDILANLLGSGGALIMCAWYHKRMLERKRAARYQMVPGDEGEDHELGVEMRDEEEEVGGTGDHDGPTVTEQLDNWDENAEDWDDHDDTPVSKSKKADDTIMPVSTETDKKATTSE